MSGDQGFVLHPLAAQDITEIWEYIAADNPLAAGRVREEIHAAIRGLIAHGIGRTSFKAGKNLYRRKHRRGGAGK